MLGKWPSTLENWLNRFCESVLKSAFFLLIEPIFSLEAIIIFGARTLTFFFFFFLRIGLSSKTLEGTSAYRHRMSKQSVSVLFSKFLCGFKGALDNIFKFSFWLNFIYHVKIDC